MEVITVKEKFLFNDLFLSIRVSKLMSLSSVFPNRSCLISIRSIFIKWIKGWILDCFFVCAVGDVRKDVGTIYQRLHESRTCESGAVYLRSKLGKAPTFFSHVAHPYTTSNEKAFY